MDPRAHLATSRHETSTWQQLSLILTKAKVAITALLSTEKMRLREILRSTQMLQNKQEGRDSDPGKSPALLCYTIPLSKPASLGIDLRHIPTSQTDHVHLGLSLDFLPCFSSVIFQEHISVC